MHPSSYGVWRGWAILGVAWLLLAHPISAQKTPASTEFGWEASAGLNLYSWAQTPSGATAYNSGQLLNLLPNLELGVWGGDPFGHRFGLVGGAEYLPLGLNLRRNNGLGAAVFYGQVRWNSGRIWSKDLGLNPYLGFGYQAQRWGLYARPQSATSPDFFSTLVVEAGIGFRFKHSELAGKRRTIGGSMYLRAGGLPDGALSVNFGIRFTRVARF